MEGQGLGPRWTGRSMCVHQHTLTHRRQRAEARGDRGVGSGGRGVGVLPRELPSSEKWRPGEGTVGEGSEVGRGLRSSEKRRPREGIC